MPRSHTGEGVTVILVIMEEYKPCQFLHNSPKRVRRVWSRDKNIFIYVRCSMMPFDCP